MTPTISDVPKLLRAIMDIEGWKQETLAAHLDVDQPQISRWLRGSKPNGENFQQILALAARKGVIGDIRSEDVAASLPVKEAPSRVVPIKGYVGAGSEAHFYAISDEDYEEVPAPAGSTDRTVAVEIKGKSWGPIMDTWLVFYDDVRAPVTEDLLGQPCVVGLADDRILIKVIKRDGNGGYRLVSNNPNEPDINDAEIEWAAKVTSMRPR